MAATTRSKDQVYLVDSYESNLTGSRLPTRKRVLQVFLHRHMKEKETKKEAADYVVREVGVFWDRAGLRMQAPVRARDNVLRLHDKWVALKKSKNARGPTQVRKEAEFKQSLSLLFDVAHADALKLANEEDRAFLIAQREPVPRGTMGPCDMSLARQVTRKRQRERQTTQRLEAAEARRRDAEEMVELASSSSSASSAANSPTRPARRQAETEPEPEPQPSTSTARPSRPKRPRATRAVVDDQLAAAMDRTKLTDRQGVHVLSAAARSLGHNPEELVINRESFRRARRKFREQAAAEIRAAFKPAVPLAVHWDGKLLPPSDGVGGQVDRLPVLVSGHGVQKLLAVPKLATGTALACADAVFTALEDWDLLGRVKSLCFDTTAVNSGLSRGACTLLEQKLERDVLHLACRHHVYELVLEKVVLTCLGPSSGPEIQLFKRFQQQWDFLDRESLEPLEDAEMPLALLESRDDLLITFGRLLDQRHPRDDYQELLELSVVVLGGVPKRGIRLRKPGAMHRARWMSKAIYAIKLHLFRRQFRLTAAEATGIRRAVVFVVSSYTAAWFQAPFAAAAPATDLGFLKALVAYPDRSLSKAVVPVFMRHLWYLSERLVLVALFDDDVPLATKRAMVAASRDREGSEDPPRRVTVDAATVQNKSLADFVTMTSGQLFDILDLDAGFLDEDPGQWGDDERFRAATLRVRALSVTNDFSERAVALFQGFNLALTRDEEQKQFLVQVVERHRRQHPDARKSQTSAN